MRPVNKPLVSIIIPAYNKGSYTIKAIKSVLSQTYNNIELIVINDGSTDDTHELLKKIIDKRFIFYDIKNSGACTARNYGINKSNGKYLSFLDCDDTYEKNKIEKSISVLERNKDYKFVYTDVNFIDKNDNIVGKTPQYRNHPGSGFIAKKLILCDFNITNSTLLMRKECIEIIGNFDEKIFIPADREFLIRLSSKFKGYYLNHNLTNYRVHNETIYKNVDIAFSEFKYMINKFNKSKIIPNKGYYNKCLSNICYNFSKIYAFNKSIHKFREMLIKSMYYNMLDKKFFYKIAGLTISFIYPKLIFIYFSEYNKFKND